MYCIVEQKDRICSYDGPDHIGRKESGFLCDYIFKNEHSEIPKNGVFIIWCKSGFDSLSKLFDKCKKNINK